MTRDVAALLLAKCEEDDRIGAYIMVSLLTGCRPEEMRALRWDHVLDLDRDQPHIAVWRSTRQHGDTEPAKSRRTLAIPQAAAEASGGGSGSRTRTGKRPASHGRTRPCIHHVHWHRA